MLRIDKVSKDKIYNSKYLVKILFPLAHHINEKSEFTPHI